MVELGYYTLNRVSFESLTGYKSGWGSAPLFVYEPFQRGVTAEFRDNCTTCSQGQACRCRPEEKAKRFSPTTYRKCNFFGSIFLVLNLLLSVQNQWHRRAPHTILLTPPKYSKLTERINTKLSIPKVLFELKSPVGQILQGQFGGHCGYCPVVTELAV